MYRLALWPFGWTPCVGSVLAAIPVNRRPATQKRPCPRAGSLWPMASG